MSRKRKIKKKKYGELRVAKNWKKGLISVLFSRLGIILIMLIFQFLILFGIWLVFGDLVGRYYLDERMLFEIIVILLLYNSPMDSSAKLSWMLLISFAPFFGSVFYVWTQIEVGHRRIKRDLSNITVRSSGYFSQDENTVMDMEKASEDSYALCRYLSKTGHFPSYENTSVEYFSFGDQKFPRMLEEIDKAKKFIFLEYFIIEEGEMWGKILELLAEKAKAGVDVRVMYDGSCVFSTLPYNYPDRLERIGIKCRMWEPIKPVITSSYNYRDHRKILVVDGKTAFCGGVNLADEYINVIDRFGKWKDTAVMLKGPAVDSLTLMFLQMWNVCRKNTETDDFSQYLELYDRNIHSQGFVVPYGDSPLNDHKIAERVYTDIINKAKDYVYITTPYLILDDNMISSLRYAAERGVDVRIILPGIPDKKAIWALSKSYYRILMDAGVRIYEYTPGFIHAKVFLSDDVKAVVGTINLDYRSLYHHFECAVYMHGVKCIGEIKKDLIDTFSRCRLIESKTIYSGKPYLSITGTVLKLVAPLM